MTFQSPLPVYLSALKRSHLRCRDAFACFHLDHGLIIDVERYEVHGVCMYEKNRGEQRELCYVIWTTQLIFLKVPIQGSPEKSVRTSMKRREDVCWGTYLEAEEVCKCMRLCLVLVSDLYDKAAQALHPFMKSISRRQDQGESRATCF